ncbi:MAG: hypothetical protein HZA63_17985 [Rhodocyclales bacterium]|nr:hypothetical protein [Rhodocyclales bacterium]
MKRGPRTIVVIGPFRSGTSLASRILSILGADFGPPETMLKADRFNPDGYFQHARVRIANNRLIRSVGSTIAWPEHPQVLADRGELKPLRRVDLAWTGKRSLRGIKDPRFCATLLAWITAGVFDPSRLLVVRVERNLDAAALDLNGMPELARQMAKRTPESARATLARYAELAAWHAENIGAPHFTLRYDDLLASPQEHIAALAAFIGAGSRRRIEAARRSIRLPQ